ncbi:MAG: rhodanese-like domain-containing protein [Microlunatus sp.]|nr:rhodanese-like domain-containing protein [Microlunatus sp.]MDN5804015.1 rhodanese-like domain-containing protein [Microlunatus sp.]
MLSDDAPAITPAEIYSKWADGWMLLDVRTDEEWDQGRIDGSVHIPMDQIAARLDEIGDRVVCICAVGARSARVTAYLNQQGIEGVNLDGGLRAWVGAGKPLVT